MLRVTVPLLLMCLFFYAGQVNLTDLIMYLNSEACIFQLKCLPLNVHDKTKEEESIGATYTKNVKELPIIPYP